MFRLGSEGSPGDADSQQTAQRVGSAIGTAVLATIFYQVLTNAGSYEMAISDALLCTAGFMFLALLLAAADLIYHWDRSPLPTPAPD